MTKTTRTTRWHQNRRGFALLVTVVVLVVLASLTAGLATRLTMAKRRQQYMIDYQQARYGLDSGIKYILSEIPTTATNVKPQEHAPDFSDLFWMDQQEYDQLVTAWAATATSEQIDRLRKEDAGPASEPDLEGLLTTLASMIVAEQSGTEPNLPADAMQDTMVQIDPNEIEVPGPYGPPWPYIMEPIELEIGPCEVTITVEDENAKLPLSWLIAPYKEDDQRVQYALETFCEWMQMTPAEMDDLRAQCELIYEQKPFQMNAGPILVRKSASTANRSSAASRFRTSQTAARRTASKPTATQKRPAIAHTTDFAKLFHSSLLNRETLAEPRQDTGERVESPLKYLGLWGSQRVNVNSAPRHVLQAALMMALTWNEAVALSEQIIERRRGEPIKNVNELKDIGLMDTETFNTLQNYVTTVSTFFKITVMSNAGNATSHAVLTVVKEGRQSETLMVLYDQ